MQYLKTNALLFCNVQAKYHHYGNHCIIKTLTYLGFWLRLNIVPNQSILILSLLQTPLPLLQLHGHQCHGYSFVDEGSTDKTFVEGGEEGGIKALVEGVMDDALLMSHAWLLELLLPIPVESFFLLGWQGVRVRKQFALRIPFQDSMHIFLQKLECYNPVFSYAVSGLAQDPNHY